MNLVDGRYDIQGLLVLDLAAQYGLPLFVYDTAVIRRQYQVLSTVFDVPRLSIHFACKSLTNVSILRYIRSMGAEVDAVSIGEIQLCLRAGFEPSQIMYTPSGVSWAECRQALDLGVKLNIDCLQTLKRIGRELPGTPVGVRLNPNVLAGGHIKISTGHRDSKFGIPLEYLQQIIEIEQQGGISVEGLHIHTGSDILDVSQFLEACQALFAAARSFSSLRYLDFGSGFKVSYHPDDKSTDMVQLGAELSKAFNDFNRHRTEPLTLIVEPGKFLVSECGILLAQTNMVKQTPATTFVMLDTGLNHLIRPMMYGAYHHITNVSHVDGPIRHYAVAGYICETDTFAWDRPIHEVRDGDVLAIHNAGAYAFSMASQYNSRPRPAEVMIADGQSYLIRKRENIDDLTATLIDVSLT